MIGIIWGSALLNAKIFPQAKPKTVSTDYGNVELLLSDKVAFLQRHGIDTPPHKINHRANIMALKKIGVRDIVAVSSVGSLKKSLKPGNLVVIDDFMQLSNIPTFFDHTIKFTVPRLSHRLRQVLIDAAKAYGCGCQNKGTYVQTAGPRLETKAEINMMKNFGDVVGMTVASEATLAAEEEMEYACICSVDNFANGITDKPISWGAIVEAQRQNIENIRKILLFVVDRLK